ncbi:RcnB family protein [Qipengyuania oceanensis]|nr:RcnB family protein [Qipengyuania oceanensis]
MSMKAYLKTGAMSVVAGALALTALPADAAAQDRGDGRFAQKAERQQARQDRREARVQERGPRIERQREQRVERQPQQQQRAERPSLRNAERPDRSAMEQARQRAQIAQQRSGREWNQSERQGREWNRSDRRSETAQERNGRDWNQSNRGERQAEARVRDVQNPYANRGGDRDRDDRAERNRSYTDYARNRTYRDGRGDGIREGDRSAGHDRDGIRYRDGRDRYRDGSYRQHEGSRYRDGDRYRSSRHGNWDRRWRDHNRYNWSRYRYSNRNIFHVGRYYSPYRSHRYSRLSIGFYLDNLFFGSRYWISDPWRYRLPPVYGDYRWVRYYDDVLLVDTWTGEVVDVIYDFFW